MNETELKECLENYRHSDDPWIAKGLFDSLVFAFARKSELLREILDGLDEIKHADHCTCPFGPKSTMYARIRKELSESDSKEQK